MTAKLKPLTPPDPKRCQAEQKSYQPFRLGGSLHETKRCEATPQYIAVEIVPAKDGLCGSMSLCAECAKNMMNVEDLRARVRLEPIKLHARKAS